MDTRCARLSYVNQRMVLLFHLHPLFNQNMFWYETTALRLKAEQLHSNLKQNNCVVCSTRFHLIIGAHRFI
jgi:hypothetical protein